MSVKTYKNMRLNIRLKAWKDNKLVLDTTRHSIGRLRNIIYALTADEYYIKVSYGKGYTKDGYQTIYNDGVYTSKKKLLKAFSIFTSKDEINDYLENFAKRDSVENINK